MDATLPADFKNKVGEINLRSGTLGRNEYQFAMIDTNKRFLQGFDYDERMTKVAISKLLGGKACRGERRNKLFKENNIDFWFDEYAEGNKKDVSAVIVDNCLLRSFIYGNVIFTGVGSRGEILPLNNEQAKIIRENVHCARLLVNYIINEKTAATYTLRSFNFDI